MKLRKILALALALCVCAALMAPMASAAYPENGTNNSTYQTITLTPSVTSVGSGKYNVTLTATMSMAQDGVAKTIAEYITGADPQTRLAKLADVSFVCGLSGTNIGTMAGDSLAYELKGDGAGLFVRDSGKDAKETNLITFNLKLNTEKTAAWYAEGDTAEQVAAKIAADLAKTVTFETTRQNVSVTFGVLTAYVDVFLGSDQYAERIAWGTTTVNDPDVGSDDSGSTTPAPTTTIEVEDEGATEGAAETAEQQANKRAALRIAQQNIRTSTDGKSGTVNETAMAKDFAENHMAYKGLVYTDPTTGEEVEIKVDANGKYEVPAGAKITVKYESIPYTPAQSGVDGLLNTKDHIAYTQGDATGKWNPDRNITRAEAATMIYRLLLNQNVEKTVSFTDVPEGKWYTEPVLVLASLGILKGSNGQFRPFDIINRAEFTAMCVRFATKEADTVGKEFADVSSTFWAHDEIGKAAALNWVIGFPDGYFKPADGMTRAQAVTMINRILARPGDASAIQAGQGVSFKDVQPTFWGYVAITESATPHDYTMNDVTFTETWVKG